MKQSFFAVLLAVSSAAAMPCPAQQSQVEREILDLEQKMNAAYAANDLPTYFAYYANDFTQWQIPFRRVVMAIFTGVISALLHSPRSFF